MNTGQPVTWPMVALALIAAIPGIIAAIAAVRAARDARSNARSLVTGNEKTVGEMVTEVHGATSEEATTFGTHRPVKTPGTPPIPTQPKSRLGGDEHD